MSNSIILGDKDEETGEGSIRGFTAWLEVKDPATVDFESQHLAAGDLIIFPTARQIRFAYQVRTGTKLITMQMQEGGQLEGPLDWQELPEDEEEIKPLVTPVAVFMFLFLAPFFAGFYWKTFTPYPDTWFGASMLFIVTLWSMMCAPAVRLWRQNVLLKKSLANEEIKIVSRLKFEALGSIQPSEESNVD